MFTTIPAIISVALLVLIFFILAVVPVISFVSALFPNFLGEPFKVRLKGAAADAKFAFGKGVSRIAYIPLKIWDCLITLVKYTPFGLLAIFSVLIPGLIGGLLGAIAAPFVVAWVSFTEAFKSVSEDMIDNTMYVPVP